MISIKDEGYEINHDPAERLVKFDGTLRLRGLNEYQPISDMLDKACQDSEHLTLNVKSLDFLNSSGIAMLSKFIITARKNNAKKITIVGSKDIPWQGKSLNNLKRLMPALELIIE